MDDREEIQRLVRRIRRNRKNVLCFTPVAVAFFAFLAWLNLRRMLLHIDAVGEASLRGGVSRGASSTEFLSDSMPVLSGMVLSAICVAGAVTMACIFAQNLFGNSESQLLLRLADRQLAEPNRPEEEASAVAAECE